MLLPWIMLMAQTAPPAAEQTATPVATGFLFKTVTIEQERYDYCVYVPPEYTRTRPWPVILFLHGSGERGRDGFLQTEVGIARAIRRHRGSVPAIVVMPQCRPEQMWNGPMLQVALRCVEQTAREYHLDPDRIYLTGLSMGGQGTWLLGAEYAERFAALVPICPFVELGPPTGLLEKIAPRLTGVPIWCFHGDADPNVPVARTRELVATIRKLGGNIRYTEVPGGGHNVWDQAYDDPELWKWLFAQKRTPQKREAPAPAAEGSARP